MNYNNSIISEEDQKGEKMIHRDYEHLKKYEKEVLRKINEEDLFDEANYKHEKEDPLGDFIDRVIDGSLYIYKNT